jgi:hypothetical protein
MEAFTKMRIHRKRITTPRESGYDMLIWSVREFILETIQRIPEKTEYM